MSDQQQLLILDLDETLIYATTKPLPRPADFFVPPYAAYLRPGVEHFLNFVAMKFRLAVWTSSSPLYAREVVQRLFQSPDILEFLWASDRCTPRRNFETDTWINTKNFRKLSRRGYDLRRVLMVDDSPEKHTHNYGNLIRVKPFEGDSSDDELVHLEAYLELLSKETNIRHVEKRGWRKSFGAASLIYPLTLTVPELPQEEALWVNSEGEAAPLLGVLEMDLIIQSGTKGDTQKWDGRTDLIMHGKAEH
ncbi:MAG TPA: HAD family hydrolase [Solimonas sp.]